MYRIPGSTVAILDLTEPDPGGLTVVRLGPSPPRGRYFRALPIPYGYGDWPDTRAAIADVLALGDLTGKTLADVGAGTGLVGILAAKQGAMVYEFEEDPDCLASCVANFQANGVNPSAFFRGRFPDEAADETYDFAYANLGNRVPVELRTALRTRATTARIVVTTPDPDDPRNPHKATASIEELGRG